MRHMRSLVTLCLALMAGYAVVAFSQQQLPAPPALQLSQTLPPSPVQTSESMHFVAFGDMGSGAPAQYAIADRLVRLYQEQPYPLVLMLGDILYPGGDVDRDGKRLIADIYAPLMAKGVYFMGALGNHDYQYHQGNRMVTFLKMPAKYYHQRVGPVDFYALDTNAFDGRQADWLKQSLATGKASWRLVFGHHPIWSSGEHGNNAHLLKTLAPLLKAGKADLYLAGHDHDYERLAPVAGTLPVISGGGGAALDRKIAPMPKRTQDTYSVLPIVSGGGGAYLRDFARVQPGSQVRSKTHHVLVLDATPRRLTIQAVTAEGHAVDCVSLEKS